jgi:hypothetical protein
LPLGAGGEAAPTTATATRSEKEAAVADWRNLNRPPGWQTKCPGEVQLLLMSYNYKSKVLLWKLLTETESNQSKNFDYRSNGSVT